MRLSHSVKSTGLIISGLLVLGLLAPSEATAAGDCPCINAGAGVCVPDPACEARQRELRDRLLREHATPPAPRSDTTMARPPTTIAPAPHTTMEYHAPAPTTLAPPPRVGTTAPPPATLAPQSTTSAVLPARPTLVPSAPPRASATAAARNGTFGSGRPQIVDTRYGLLSELGKEAAGYGLYSYAILPSETKRGEIFLTKLFEEVASIGTYDSDRLKLNIVYIPAKRDREIDFATLRDASGTTPEKMAAETSRSFYDYGMARALLDHVCNSSDDDIRRTCRGGLSRGPYIFTYASPASTMSLMPPPFLFVDLSDIHEQAFGEFVDAFKAQVKRDDITDKARIRTLRLTILSVALTAADWVNPVEKAVADIVHSPSDDNKQ
jgi:hypothetical protein